MAFVRGEFSSSSTLELLPLAINRDKVEAAAIKLLQQGKYDKAIVELKKLVDDDKTDVRTLLKLGDTHVKMGAKKESIESYEKAAAIYTEQGFYLKAVAVFKQILRVDANIPELHLKLAELYQQLGLTSDALQHYQNVAVFHEQQGRPREALDMLKRMVDLDPDNIASRIKLGELFAQQGLAAEASQELRSALTFLKQQQRFDDYVRVGEKLVQYDQGALDVAQELAQIYMQRQQPQVALGKLQMCFKADPRNVDVLSMIAQAFLDMQQVAKTVSVFKEMAKIYAADGNSDLATRTWERVLELQPDDGEAETALGRVSPQVTAPVHQRTLIPTVVAPAQAGAPLVSAPQTAAPPRVNPEDEQLQRLLTETDVYVKYGLRDKAIEHIQKVFALRPDHVPALEKLKQLQQAVQQKGGSSRDIVDTLKKLVAAAARQGHPRVEEWRGELTRLDSSSSSSSSSSSPQPRPAPSSSGAAVPAPAPPAPAAAPVRPSTMPSLRAPISAPTAQASSDEGELFITDDPSSSAIAADDSFGDEPLTADSSGIISLDDNASGIMELPADSEEGFLPPTGSLMDELPPDEHGLDDLPPAAHRAGASVPRMPTGVMDASPYPAPMKPPSPLSPPAPLRPPPLQLRPEDAVVDVNEADDLVRRALQDISAEDVAAAADELLLEPELIHAGPDEVAPPALKGRSAPVIPRENAASKSPLAAAISSAGGPRSGNDIDRLAREAVADANKSLAHKQSDVAATALMQLNDEELDEIREFEVETSSRQRGLSSSSNTGPSPVLQVRDELDSFDDPTLALAPPARSSEVTDERPKRAPAGTHSSLLANRPTTSSSGPHPIVHGEPDSVDEDAPTLFVRPADMLAQGSALSKQAPPSLAKPAHRAVAAPPPVVASDFSDEFDPSSFDLPADVKELLRKGEADVAAFDASLPSLSAPAAPAPLPMVDELDAFAEPSSGDITLRGKLGLQDKAQGFEDDPANQFFPDELEEAEFFIKNDLLDEAKEILTAILEDVPESARAQWMLARIEAKERGEAEPPAPWEQRILEEVQAQLDDLGLLDDPHTKQMEARDGTSPQISVEEVLSQFKKGVAETVPEEDAATHYELGIAYREMGLHDDAVNEFLIAARAPTRAADARYMIGNVRKEQGKLDEAVTAFEEAAAQTSASKTQKGAADYERGVLLEELGRDKEALWALKAAKQNGHAAPDLDRRISALVARVGDSNPPPKGNGSNGNGTNGNGHGKAGDKPAVPRPKNIDYV